jgi:hypothetical protein
MARTEPGNPPPSFCDLGNLVDVAANACQLGDAALERKRLAPGGLAAAA